MMFLLLMKCLCVCFCTGILFSHDSRKLFVLLMKCLFVCFFTGIVHENPRIGSDGESEEVSGASDEKDDMVSPVKLRLRQRRFSEVSMICLTSS